MKQVFVAVFGLVIAPLALSAAAKTIQLPQDNAMAKLKPGSGLSVVETNCSLCHSTDYIVRQAGGDAKHWEPEVKKMVTVYGAIVSDDDVKTIVNYLATEYGEAPAQEQAAKGKR